MSILRYYLDHPIHHNHKVYASSRRRSVTVGEQADVRAAVVDGQREIIAALAQNCHDMFNSTARSMGSLHSRLVRAESEELASPAIAVWHAVEHAGALGCAALEVRHSLQKALAFVLFAVRPVGSIQRYSGACWVSSLR